MARNFALVMAGSLIKGKLRPGALTGLERFMLAQLTMPDRVPTALAATNVEPHLIDEKYNYVMLANSVEANLELFAKVVERFPFDVIMVPCWLGLMLTGVAELGVQFEIEDDRVPYASTHPIQGIEDVKRIKPFTDASGYFKMTLEIYREAQRRFRDTMITFPNDGPWDLAMLLRGDKQLPLDFRIYKDYSETQDPHRREKIKKFGDPGLWPAIMDLTTEISIQIFKLAAQHGINMMGASMVDQFATKPVLGVEDFQKYVLPYSEKAREALGGKVAMAYFVVSPQELEKWLSHPKLGKSLGMSGFTNYIFPTTPEGLSLPEYDQPMLELTKKNKRTYNYMVHAKFIRDATGQQLEDAVKRICEMATQMKVRMMISVGAIAPGTDLEKIDLLLDSVHKYGRY
ncbi:uroporphyrinogen decarboxylase family protein [Chloroflexota bacterium]